MAAPARHDAKPLAGPPLPAAPGDGVLRSAPGDAANDPLIELSRGCRVHRLNWLAELRYGGTLRGALACETPFFRRDACDGCPIGECATQRRARFFTFEGEGARLELAAFPDGGDGAVVLRVADATSRTATERRLDLLGDVVEAIQEGVLGLDADGVVRMANRRAAELLPGGAVGCAIAGLLRFADPGDQRRFEQALTGRQKTQIEGPLAARDGGRSDLHVVARLDPMQDGERCVGFALIVRDVTEAKFARERLRQTEKMSVLGSFVSGLAHELNNPLAAIHGRAERLARAARGSAGAVAEDAPAYGEPRDAPKPGDTIEAQAEAIQTAARHCGRIIQGLLRFARKDGGGRRPIDLTKVAADAIDLAGHGLAREGTRVRLRAADRPATVVGDPTLLAQVVVNLLVNAHQAMRSSGRAGTIDVATRVEADACVLDVADEGPGISAAAEARLFERFFTTKPPGEGTGLGLTVSKEIVEEHGGSIAAGNRSDAAGARFTVRLPAVDAPGGGAAPEATSAAGEARRLAVLVAEDEPAILEWIAALVRSLGHTVTACPGGAAALPLLRAAETPFDVVVSDVRMEPLDGPALYRAACEREPRYRGRFVFVSGDLLVEGSAAEQALGLCEGNAWIAKPFRAEELGDALRRMDERARIKTIRALR